MHNVRTLHFYERMTIIDAIKANPNPSEEVIDFLVELLEDENYRNYFYDQLKDPRWVEPLLTHGAFNHVDRWASIYLARVAQFKSDGVVEVMTTSEVNDFLVQQNLMRVLLSLPIEKIARVISSNAKWLYDQPNDHFLPELLSKICDDENTTFELLEKILVTQPSPDDASSKSWHEPKPNIDQFYLKQLFGIIDKEVGPKYPFRLLAFLHDRLEQASSLERGLNSYWRSSIKRIGDEEIYLREHLHMLLDRIVALMEQFSKDDPHKIQLLVKTDLQHSLTIFQRLAIYLVGEFPTEYPEIVEQIYSRREFLEDSKLQYEFYWFLKKTYSTTSSKNQKVMLEWILEGPLQSNGEDPEYDRHWQIRQLIAIKNYLPENILDEFPELRGPTRDPAPGGFGTVTTWIGSKSPLSKEELRQYTNDELIEFIILFDEPKDSRFIDAPSKKGLANTLKSLVEIEPQRFAEIAEDFANVPPIYSVSLLSGLTEAVKSDQTFDWLPVTTLCRQLPQGEIVAESIDDVSLAELRKSAARLIRTGLSKRVIGNSEGNLPVIRDILFRLLESENSQWVTDSELTPVDMSLNTAHAVTTWTLIEYALRYADLYHPKTEETQVDEIRLEHSVQVKLEHLIKEANDPGVRAAIGAYLARLAYLNYHWFIDILSWIFPSDPDRNSDWQAIWEGYLFFNDRPYEGLFQLIRPQYERGIIQLSEERSGSNMTRIDVNMKLASHIALLYLWDIEDLEWESLVQKFLSNAPDRNRADIVTYMSNTLRHASDRGEIYELWPKLKEYWQVRSEVFETSGTTDSFEEEAQRFFMWLDHIPEPFENIYPMINATAKVAKGSSYIDREIVGYLKSQAQLEPFLTSDVLWNLIQQSGEKLLHQLDEIQSILEIISRSDDDRSKENVNFIVNFFGKEFGIHRFRYLLE